MFRGGALGVMERWKPDCTSALVLGEIMLKNIFYEKICYVFNSRRYDHIPGFARTPLVILGAPIRVNLFVFIFHFGILFIIFDSIILNMHNILVFFTAICNIFVQCVPKFLCHK